MQEIRKPYVKDIDLKHKNEVTRCSWKAPLYETLTGKPIYKDNCTQIIMNEYLSKIKLINYWKPI